MAAEHVACNLHFPTACDEKLAFLSIFATPVMLRGIPAQPDSGSAGLEMSGSVSQVSTCGGSRPLSTLARDGEQQLKT